MKIGAILSSNMKADHRMFPFVHYYDDGRKAVAWVNEQGFLRAAMWLR